MNYSSMSPFHGVQSLRNRLHQHGSSTGTHALPANLLHPGLLSPQGHSSCKEPAPARAPHGVTASFGHPSALSWGPPRAAGGDLLHHGPPRAAGDSLPYHGHHHGLQGNLLRRLEHLLRSFCTEFGVFRVVSLTYSYSSIPLQLSGLEAFSPFLNLFS